MQAVLMAFLTLMLVSNCNTAKKVTETETEPAPEMSLTPAQYRASIAMPTKDSMKIAFYNTENLFDTIDDPQKDDAEFLPNGKMKWTADRYQTKLSHIEQVAEAMDFPVVMGFCEIENRLVLEDLLKQPKMKMQGYEIAHFDSPDERGIDVGLIYKKAVFSLKNSKPHRVSLVSGDKTRDILEVSGTLANQNVHIFVNHWPSRRGGQVESDDKRMTAAKTLKIVVDSIQKNVKNSYIIAMGDLNDEPIDKSLTEGLGAKDPSVYKRFLSKNLYNMSFPVKKRGEGSYYYQKSYTMIDQIVISGNFLQTTSPLKSNYEEGILRANFLYYTDKKTGESFPNRTYTGEKYRGGYSDHLPVYLTIYR